MIVDNGKIQCVRTTYIYYYIKCIDNATSEISVSMIYIVERS